MALFHLSRTVDDRFVAGWILAINLISYVTCARDKSKAQKGLWRTPESTLHGLELAVGWVGSFVAQRQFRHKTAKTRYQVHFWIIVALYQVVSLDYLLGWELLKYLSTEIPALLAALHKSLN